MVKKSQHTNVLPNRSIKPVAQTVAQNRDTAVAEI